MLKNITYYLRIISVVLFILFVLINIFTVLSRKDIYKELISYNLISIALCFYLGIIVFKLYTDYRAHSLMYNLNYDYFKTNFIIIDLVILGIILNTLFIYFYDRIKED